MLPLLLSTSNPQFDSTPTDTAPQNDRGDINLDETRLLDYLVKSFTDAIRYKEYLGWVEKREYDIKAYYQQKELAWASYPWKGASAYRSPLIATLTDTAWAYMSESVWPDSGNPLQVKGFGREDVRTAKILSAYLNNDLESKGNAKFVHNQNIFRMFHTGTGITKTRRSLDGESILSSSVSVEDIYCPLSAEGFEVDQTEYVHQVIGMTKNELDLRRLSGVYDFRDGEIAPGIAITTGTAKERITFDVDRVTGTDHKTEIQNSIYYVVESYCTYYEKNSLRPLELIVWWVPNGSKILRKRINDSKIRPFARYVAYEIPGRFYGLSLGEKVKEIQDKIDYSDKQFTDMLDRASMPAMFLDDTSTFDPDISQRVPGGIYPMGVGNKIIFEPQPTVERGFDQERFNLWMQAERLTGLNDVIQGASTRSGRTLGETEIRQNAAGIRFNSLFKRYEEGFNAETKIRYKYHDMYVPRSKKISLIGYEDYQTIGELFPSDSEDVENGFGIKENVNFGFSGRPVSERENDKANFEDYYLAAMANPITASNPANLARLLREKAERNGIRNHDSLVGRLKEENILTPEEFIQRIMSGQYNLTLRPGIDADNYILEIDIFMRTDMFQNMSQKGKLFLLQGYQQAKIISEMERRALVDVEQMRIETQISAAARNAQTKEKAPESIAQTEVAR